MPIRNSLMFIQIACFMKNNSILKKLVRNNGIPMHFC